MLMRIFVLKSIDKAMEFSVNVMDYITFVMADEYKTLFFSYKTAKNEIKLNFITTYTLNYISLTKNSL